MKHILNEISLEEKKRILEQHNGGKKLVIENFNKLVNNKLGTVKPLVSEDVEPPIGGEGEGEKVEITPQEKEEMKTEILGAINELPSETKVELGIEGHSEHDTEKTLNSILQHSHFHIDPLNKHLELELPGFGKNHNIKPVVGLSYETHGKSHDGGHDSHGMSKTSTLSSLEPHKLFNVGVRFSASELFKKGH